MRGRRCRRPRSRRSRRRSSTTARVSRNARSAAGQMRADDREHREGERDVGGRRDRPAVARRAVVPGHREVEQRGHDHAADGGDDRQRRRRRGAQRADHELALELEPGDEEEDGEQAVGRPRLQGQVEVQRTWGRRRRPGGRRTSRSGRCSPRPAGDGRGQEQGAADGLGAHRVEDELALGTAAVRGAR